MWTAESKGEEAQEEAFYSVARHEYQYATFYKTIYRMIPLLNITVSYVQG